MVFSPDADCRGFSLLEVCDNRELHLAYLPDLHSFSKLVLAARTLIRALIVTGQIRKDAHEPSASAALGTTRTDKKR